ncbi:nucleotide-binding protein [Limobrevibacterium gyesilva]|uniref:Conjugal transfer protein TraL n=1 Tax=Limobrevibacterium gyesilva TaxID=2991712 RepID=A0AA41YMI6_9PROT|nr:conjugal transfer protein TraL [Limobrevibacterium gyesilva]MCW3476244.1 conjugal transfer protein TraL [Limobrevibacterium gyesilva]
MPDSSPREPSSTIRSNGPAITNDSSAPAGDETAGARKVHFILQGKGGVGKTFVASLLAQFYQEKEAPLVCLDTDPVNSSFSAIRTLGARHVSLLAGDGIDVDALDELVERVMSEDAHFVIDNGAASFVPLSRYLVEHDIAGLIAGGGKRVVVHTILTGGPAMLDTGKALAAVMEQFPPSVELVVWLNEFFGPIVTDAGEGFERTPLYQQNRARISGLVHLEQLNPDTFGRNLRDMLSRQITFAEADQSPEFRIVARQRLRQVWRLIRDQIALIA